MESLSPLIDLQADVKKHFPKMSPPRLELFYPENPKRIGELTELDYKAIDEFVREDVKKSPFAPNKPAAKKASPEEKEIRRRRVLQLWNSGEHDTWKMADMLGSTRGAVYSDLRALGIKKKG